MALKMDRQIDAWEVSYFLNETAERGVVVSVSTAGSGIALEDSLNVATIAANSSGNRPIGVLLTDFVNYDLTRTPINWHKDQAQIGDKAAIATKGWVITNKITNGATVPVAGDFAALSSSGTVTNITPTVAVTTWNKIANPKVGTFRTKPNEDGFARIYIDL